MTRDQRGRTNFEIDVRDDVDPPHVRVRGEIDIATVAAFEEGVRTALGAGVEVVVDMSETTFMDSTGLSALVRVAGGRSDSEGARPSLVLIAPSPPVAKTLEISGIDRLVTIRDA